MSDAARRSDDVVIINVRLIHGPSSLDSIPKPRRLHTELRVLARKRNAAVDEDNAQHAA